MSTAFPWGDGERPQHDPVAEEMDLLTHQEVAARVYDELVVLQAQEEEELTRTGDAERLFAVRRRISDLQAAVQRIQSRRSPLDSL